MLRRVHRGGTSLLLASNSEGTFGPLSRLFALR